MPSIAPRLWLAGSLLVISSFCAPARAAPQIRRYALTMMHFNIQYVAGGMTG